MPQNKYLQNKIIIPAILVIAILVGLHTYLAQSPVQQTKAFLTRPVCGFIFSEIYGWGRVNSRTPLTPGGLSGCNLQSEIVTTPPSQQTKDNFGVFIDGNGVFRGRTFFENIGWLTWSTPNFLGGQQTDNSFGVTITPDGKLSGFARFDTTIMPGSPPSFVKFASAQFSGSSSPQSVTQDDWGVFYNGGNGDLGGFAFSEIFGWLQFSSNIHATRAVPFTLDQFEKRIIQGGSRRSNKHFASSTHSAAPMNPVNIFAVPQGKNINQRFGFTYIPKLGGQLQTGTTTTLPAMNYYYAADKQKANQVALIKDETPPQIKDGYLKITKTKNGTFYYKLKLSCQDQGENTCAIQVVWHKADGSMETSRTNNIHANQSIHIAPLITNIPVTDILVEITDQAGNIRTMKADLSAEPGIYDIK